ncbi:hypothetical protein [Bradyrhizobium sp. Tv2a-2]|uniref:hypothetical protein n=1 Tax=Bradyrhizobium sp. Tv2a-2 TaxID=113395 RepID=UPI0012EC11B1|nr:hypothetical protein [Bradyrhizobium sp. Tv2a-2]
MEGAFKELVAAGYAARDEVQGRDERNRFTTLNYIVSDVSSCDASDVRLPRRAEPKRKTRSGNKKERINTDFTNPFPRSPPGVRERSDQASQRQYTDIGNQAAAAGQCAVFVGSEPYEAWRRFRGEDGMPGFVDKAIIDGRVHAIVEMKSPAGRCFPGAESGALGNDRGRLCMVGMQISERSDGTAYRERCEVSRDRQSGWHD